MSSFGPQAQLFGAWFGIGIAALWATRRFLVQQFKFVFRDNDEDDQEVRMVRHALVGLTLGGVFVLFFLYQRRGIRVPRAGVSRPVSCACACHYAGARRSWTTDA